LTGAFEINKGREALGAVHKRRPHFLVQKTPDFLKFMVCPHGQGREEVRRCGHFANKGEEVIFRDFVQMSFMDSPLAQTHNTLCLYLRYVHAISRYLYIHF